ncbi:response regulator transcription factor [Phaeovulum sp.]|uniref:response regulator transcription factor n=1 Tax=Phaeovulum sp. TaxID=2934796 RepID=UPI003569D7E4
MQAHFASRPGYVHSTANDEMPKALVLSSRHYFPNSLLRSVNGEIGTLQVERLDTLDAYFSLSEDERAKIALVIIGEEFAFELARLDASKKRALQSTPVALAYQDARLPNAVLATKDISPLIRSYIPMNVRFDIFISIIHLLVDGGVYIPQEVGGFGVQANSYGTPAKSETDEALSKSARLNALSAREHEVLELIARGKQNKSIAAELDLSEHTVKLHTHNIIRKLRVNNRTGAAALFLSGD